MCTLVQHLIWILSSGVRQGGVLSPILFTIYIDELLLQLKRDGIGCHWGHLFAGAFCYADNLIFFAPSLSALFAVSHEIKFNGSKTQLIRFGREPSCDCQAVISCGGTQLHFVNTVTHLGHLLTYDLSDSADITSKTRDMVKKANSVRLSFAGIDPAILTHLLSSFRFSLHGAALWNLSN